MNFQMLTMENWDGNMPHLNEPIDLTEEELEFLRQEGWDIDEEEDDEDGFWTPDSNGIMHHVYPPINGVESVIWIAEEGYLWKLAETFYTVIGYDVYHQNTFVGTLSDNGTLFDIP